VYLCASEADAIRVRTAQLDAHAGVQLAAVIGKADHDRALAWKAFVLGASLAGIAVVVHFNTSDLAWPERILRGAFIFGVIGLSTFVGLMTPGVGWFLYVFLIPFWAMFPLVIVGARGTLIVLATYVVGYPIAS
jgi:hypothetical protein